MSITSCAQSAANTRIGIYYTCEALCRSAHSCCAVECSAACLAAQYTAIATLTICTSRHNHANIYTYLYTSTQSTKENQKLIDYQEGYYKKKSQLPWLVFQLQVLQRGVLNHLHEYPKSFSHSLHVLYPSPPRLAASVIVFTTSLVAPICGLPQLVYLCFAVATMPHPLEASTYYHVLFHKVISQYITKALH